MDGEEYKNGKADSENGSDNSYVQVSPEDAQRMSAGESPSPPMRDSPQLISGSGVPPEEEFEEEERDITITDNPQPKSFQDDPFYMESTDPQAEEEAKAPSSTKAGVEDLLDAPVQSGPVSSTSRMVAPKPSGYLCFLRHLHPAVLYIIYWQEPKLSAVVLGVDMVVLLTLTLNTFLHTIVLLLLSFLVVSLTYIVTKIAIDSFYNRNIQNPFSEYLKQGIDIPEDKAVAWARCSIHRLSEYLNGLMRLLLFENIKRSLKFGVFLWLISFTTNCFNILTVLFCATALLFGIPPLYTMYQAPIDNAVKGSLCKVKELFQKVRSLVPFMKKSKLE